VIYIGLFGVVVLALFAYVYWSTAHYLYTRADQAIETEIARLQKTYSEGGRVALTAALAERAGAHGAENGLYLLADPSFMPVAGNLKVWPEALKADDGAQNFKVGETDAPLLRATVATLPDGYRLLVGKNIDEIDAFARKINAALLLGLILIFVLAGVASVSVTKRTVGRIEAINATSRTIMQSGLGERISVRGTRDEWDQLAGNLNQMLDRIEGLMGDVKQVTDNVAHDLRTPLARMRGRLEKAYNRPRDSDDDQAMIGDTIADLDGVLRMFASLMRISQIEANDRAPAFRTVNLTEIANEVVELFDAAAEQKGGHLSVIADQEVLVTGDRDLLFDAVANLVDNAIKHGREAGDVKVDVTQADDGAVISVADHGPGIPADECQKVLKHFYRLERSRRTAGNGLGLSLVAAVTRLHGARIEMIDNAPGLKFRLMFPLQAEAQDQRQISAPIASSPSPT
jgi:signal transduction histidine kinase